MTLQPGRIVGELGGAVIILRKIHGVQVWRCSVAVLGEPFLHIFSLFGMQGKCDEAATLYQRSLAIIEKTLGPDHPALARTLNNLAMALKKQVRAVGNFERISVIFSVDIVMSKKMGGVVESVYESHLKFRGIS